ncbi:hypothetical protein [Rhodococcus sp. NPDC055024]
MIDRDECAAAPPERNRSINMPDTLRGSQPVHPGSKTGLRMLDYTTIDFETANSYRGSPRAVNLVRVRDVTIRQSTKNRSAHYKVNTDAQDENYLARRGKVAYGDYPPTKLTRSDDGMRTKVQ